VCGRLRRARTFPGSAAEPSSGWRDSPHAVVLAWRPTPHHGGRRDPASAASVEDLAPRLRDVYVDLHAHPELSFAERRTAGASPPPGSTSTGEVAEGVGGTGVVGVLRRGPGPWSCCARTWTLPVLEGHRAAVRQPGARRRSGRSGRSVMHACGDVHVTCLMGAAALLAGQPAWRGRSWRCSSPPRELARGASRRRRRPLREGPPARRGARPARGADSGRVPRPATRPGVRRHRQSAGDDARVRRGHDSRPGRPPWIP
jgi:hippurate hydrolase